MSSEVIAPSAESVSVPLGEVHAPAPILNSAPVPHHDLVPSAVPAPITIISSPAPGTVAVMMAAVSPAPMINSENTPPSKSKRTQLTLQDKLQICKAIQDQQGLTQSDLAEKYHCSHSTISKILKNKERWVQASQLPTPVKVRLRKTKFPLVEQALDQWYNAALMSQVAIGDDVLKEKARHIAKLFDFTEEQFKCSDGWLAGFKQRYNIQGVKLHSEVLALPANHQAMLALPAAPHLVEDGHHAPEGAVNMDISQRCDIERIVHNIREQQALVDAQQESQEGGLHDLSNIPEAAQALADADAHFADILHPRPSSVPFPSSAYPTTPTSSSSSTSISSTPSTSSSSVVDGATDPVELMRRTIAFLEQTGKAVDAVATLRKTMRQLEDEEASSNKRQKST